MMIRNCCMLVAGLLLHTQIFAQDKTAASRTGEDYTLSALPALGVNGIWIAIPIGWFLADATGILLWRREGKSAKTP